MTFKGAFKLHDTMGFPLVAQLHVARQRGIAVSLPAFYMDAFKAGWSHAKIASTIHEAVCEVSGPVVAEKVADACGPLCFLRKEP